MYMRIFLYSLIGSVLLAAVLGITALLSGGLGPLGTSVVLTTATIALASTFGLACGAGVRGSMGPWIARVGIGLCVTAAGMFIVGIWNEGSLESYWKLAASTSVWAVACAHLSLLGRAKLDHRFRWSLTSTLVVTPATAGLVTMAIFSMNVDESMFRLLGVLAILDTALTVLITIFHRLSRATTPVPARTILRLDTAAIDAEIVRLKRKLEQLEDMRRQA